MARTAAGLPTGTRVTDFISLGAIAAWVPMEKVHEVLREEGRESQRQRKLPAHVVVYYVIALALYMGVAYGEVLRCLVEGLGWLGLPVQRIRTTGPSGISQARSRVGVEPLRRLYEELVEPVAVERTRGAWYRGWRLVSLDGSTFDVADEAVNAEAFGRPGASRGASGFPQLRFVSLVESGTHVLFGAEQGPYTVSEIEIARAVVTRLRPQMLCLADRNFFSFALWSQAADTGADLLWRMKRNAVLPCHQRLEDGSYLSKVYPSEKDRRHDRRGRVVRVIEYTLEGVEDPEPLYRVLTTLLDPAAAPAPELAALYHERWEIESAFDELKTHLRGRGIVLRSKTPELVRQEFYGLLLAHYALRGIMHEAALQADLDPDELSFVHTVRVVKRKILTAGSFPPSGEPALP
jgi:Insertion element 4 transposase N-terminal/Transposase DDE domain